MITARSKAKSEGLKRYASEKPCSKGHMQERYTSSGGCCLCASESYNKWSENNAGRCKDLRKDRYVNSIDKVKTQSRVWRAENPLRVRTACTKWRHENPEAERAIKAARRARERAAEGKWYPSDIERIYTYQEGCCAGCKNTLDKKSYHVDHKQPLALGGSNWPWNLQLLCASCNCKKWAKSYEQWEAEKA